MSLSKVIETARAELGQHEDPAGSNLTKYGFWYGVNGVPWCVIFLCWLFNEAGERMAFFGGGKTASCSVLLRWYKEQGLTVPVSEVQVGDIVLLNFHGGKDPEHCGLVTAAGDYEGQTFVWTIEGNTSTAQKANQDNGGIVAEKIRYEYQIVAVCRPQYKPDDPQPVDDVSGHWFTPSVEWAREKELIKNYPDGSFKPNQPITRAEACVMLERFYQLLWEDDMR
jgi:hypothetical protein